MKDARPKLPTLPPVGLLRKQISLALCLKVLLLTGLWFLLFRWPERPQSKSDIASHFSLTTRQTPETTDSAILAAKEKPNVR
jgi:hypothetical protein